jgi:hypothetical protein
LRSDNISSCPLPQVPSIILELDILLRQQVSVAIEANYTQYREQVEDERVTMHEKLNANTPKVTTGYHRGHVAVEFGTMRQIPCAVESRVKLRTGHIEIRFHSVTS